MNEEYLNKLYQWIVSKDPTYSNSISPDAFIQKMQDKDYAGRMHNWITRKDPSFNSSLPLDAFYNKIGVGKKKEDMGISAEATTESISPQTSSSVSSSNQNIPPSNQLQQFADRFMPKQPQQNIDLTGSSIVDGKKIITTSEADRQKWSSPMEKYIPTTETEAEKEEKASVVNPLINALDSNLIQLDEEAAVPKLNYLYGPLDFKFEQAVPGADYITVTAPDGKTQTTIRFDPLFGMGAKENAEQLKNFIRTNVKEIPKSQFDILSSRYNKDKTYLNEEEYNNDIKYINDQSSKILIEEKDIAKQYESLSAELNALNAVPANEKTNPQYIEKARDLQVKLNSLQERVDYVNESKSKLNDSELVKSTGRYAKMKADQGDPIGAAINEFTQGYGRIFNTNVGNLVQLVTQLRPTSDLFEYGYNRDAALKIAAETNIRPKKEDENFMSWLDSLPADDRQNIINGVQDKIVKGVLYGTKESEGISDKIRSSMTKLIGDESTTKEYAEDIKQNNFVGGAVLGAVGSIPAMLGPAPLRVFSMMAQSSDYLDEEMQNNPNFENISEGDKNILKTLVGVPVAILEEYGLRNMIASKGYLNNLLFRFIEGKTASQITSKSFAEFVRNDIKSGFARAGLTAVGGALAEAETGAMQQAWENSVKSAYNEYNNWMKANPEGAKMFNSPDFFSKDMLVDVVKGGVQEAIGGLVLGTPNAVAAGMRGKGFLGMSDSQFKIFEGMANDENLLNAWISSLKAKVANGDLKPSEAREQLNDYRNAVGLYRQITGDLTTEQKKEAMNLIRERNAIKQSIEGKDPQLTVKQRNRIDEINNQLTKLPENAIQEPETEGGLLRPEQPQVGLQEMGEGNTQGQAVTEVPKQEQFNEQDQERLKTLSERLKAAREVATNSIVIDDKEISIDDAEQELKALFEKQLRSEMGAATPVTEITAPAIETPTNENKNLLNNRNTDLFPRETDFANSIGNSGSNSNLDSYNEVNGVGVATYTNPNNGMVDVIMSATSDNDYVGYVRIYENGKPTNRFTSKMSNESGNKSNFKIMIKEAQSRLPKGHEYTESTSISLDGVRVFADQLNRGYEILTDESGNPITRNVTLNRASVEGLRSETNQEQKEKLYEDLEVESREEFEKIKDKILKMMPQAKVFLNKSNNKVLISLPILVSTATPVTEVTAPATQVSPAIAPTIEVTPMPEAKTEAVAPNNFLIEGVSADTGGYKAYTENKVGDSLRQESFSNEGKETMRSSNGNVDITGSVVEKDRGDGTKTVSLVVTEAYVNGNIDGGINDHVGRKAYYAVSLIVPSNEEVTSDIKQSLVDKASEIAQQSKRENPKLRGISESAFLSNAKANTPTTQTTPATDTTTQAAPNVVVASNTEGINTIIQREQRVANTSSDANVRNTASTKAKVLSSALNALKTLRSILPDIDIHIHENENTYNELMPTLEGVKGSAGNFSVTAYQDGRKVARIDINLSKANARTVIHEASHAILFKAFGDNPSLFKSFKNKLASAVSKSDNARLNKFISQYTNVDVRPEEYLVELSAILSTEGKRLSPTVIQRIAKLINDIVGKFTNGKLVPFRGTTTALEMQEFMNSMANALRSGGEITIQERKGAVSEIGKAQVKSKSSLNPALRDVESTAKALENVNTFDQQDAKAEVIVGKEKDRWGRSQVWRERIENAGDILRELSSRGKNPDVKYLQEKINKLKSWILNGIGFSELPKGIKTLKDVDESNVRFSSAVDGKEYLNKFHNDVLQETIYAYKGIVVKTQEEQVVKDFILTLLEGDKSSIYSKLKDVEDIVYKIEKQGELKSNPLNVSKAYHKAKADGSNPELVKAVEGLLSPQVMSKSSLNPALRDVESTAKALEGKDISVLSKELGIEANWDMIGEGDVLSGKDPILAYTQKQLPDWNRESQRGEVNPNSKLTYDIVRGNFGGIDNKEIVEAKDENGVVVAVVKLDSKGGIEHIAIAPEFRGKGVAYKLIEKLKESNPNLDLSKTKLRSKGFEKTFAKNIISEAYHKAKKDGSNPELVKAVEDLLSPQVMSKSSLPSNLNIIDGWYSNIEKNILESNIDKQSANKWLTSGLIGKGDEATYTGVRQWLESKNPQEQVSKSEILKWMKDNRISIVEVVKGIEQEVGEQILEDEIYNNINDELSRKGIDDDGLLDAWYYAEQNKDQKWDEVVDFLNSNNLDLDNLIEKSEINSSAVNDTKYYQYQLEGDKKNYKEVLVTLPPSREKLSEIQQKALEAKSAEELAEKMFKDNAKIKLSEDAKKGGYEDGDGSIQQAALTLAMYNEGRGDSYGRKQLEDRLKYLAGDSYNEAKKLGEEVNQAYKEADKKRVEKVEGVFKSTHFDEPNILVHLRMNTRTDVDGNKVLFLEEIQSDWGQQGKNKGFANMSISEYEKLKKEYDDLYDDLNNKPLSEEYKRNLSIVKNDGLVKDADANVWFIPKTNYEMSNKSNVVDINLLDDKVKRAISYLDESLKVRRLKQGKLKELESKLNKSTAFGPTTAPFVTDTNAWTKLGLKVALREAVKQDVDKIAWTTGNQQNERYSLEKQVDEVGSRLYSDGTYGVVGRKDGETVFENNKIPENKLSEYVGKELAEKIITNASEDAKWQYYEGEDLKVGGKGMRGFYDSIVPNVATSLVKDITGQKGEIIDTNIKLNEGNESTQKSIEITPEIKNKVEEGIPLFSKASLAEEEGMSDDNINNIISRARDTGLSYDSIRDILVNLNVSDDKISRLLNLEPKRTELNERNLPGYDGMMRTIGEIVDKTIKKRFKTRQEALDNVINWLQGKSAAYANATDIQREQIIRDINKMFDVKEKSAPSKEKVLGKKKTKVTVDEMSALKDQIRLEARAAREAKMDINSIRASIAKVINAMEAKGTITARQAQVIINKFGKLNLDSVKQVENFFQYMEKVFADAEYDTKIRQARKNISALKKLAKNKKTAINLTSLAREFLRVDPAMVEDIDKYNAIAEQIIESLKGTKINRKDLDVLVAGMVSQVDVMDYVWREVALQEEAARKLSQQLAEQEFGVDANDFTYEQIQELLADDTVEIPPKYNDVIMSKLKDMFDRLSSVIQYMINDKEDPFTYESVEFTDSEKKVINDFMSMDISKLSIKDAARAMDALHNFIVNRSTASMDAVVAKYTANENIDKIIREKIKARPVKLFWSKTIGGTLLEGTGTIFQMYERMFGNFRLGSYIEKLSGIRSVLNGFAKANTMTKNMVNEYVDMFYKKQANGEAFNTGFNDVERGMFSYVNRSIFATKERIQNIFDTRKKLIEDSIELLMNGTSEEQEIGKIYQDVYDKILKDSNSIDDVRSKVDPVNLEAVEFWINKWDSVFDTLSDVCERVYNTILDKFPNFTPIRYINLKDTEQGKLTEEDILRSSFVRNNGSVTKKAKSLMAVEDNSKMPKGKYVNLSFDTVNSNAMLDALSDSETAAGIRQVLEFINSSKLRQIIPDGDDRSLFINRIKLYLQHEKNATYNNKSNIDKAIRITSKFIGYGARLVLGQVLQAPKQTIPIISDTITQTGKINFFDYFDTNKYQFMMNSGRSIANRLTMSNDDLKSINKLIEYAAKSKGEKAINAISKVSEIYVKNFLARPDAFAAQSSWILFYEKSLKDQGIPLDGYWKQPINDDAADYASRMVERGQGTSEQSSKGTIFVETDSVRSTFFRSAMPLASFLMTAKNRMQSDIIALCVSTSNTQDRIMHARSLAGQLVQSAIFTGLSIYIGYRTQLLIRKLMGRDDDEEEKKEILKKKTLAGGAKAVGDLISPLPPLNSYVVSGINMISKKYQGMKGLDEKEMILFPEFEDNQKFGLAGEVINRITTFYDIANMGLTGEYTDDYGKTHTISQDDQDFIYRYATIPAFANIMGLLPTESSQFVNNVLKTAKKGTKEKKEQEKEDNKNEKIEQQIQMGGFKNKTDLKRYNPELYNKLYGKESPNYEQQQDIKELEKKQREEIQKIKDEMYDYISPNRNRKNKKPWETTIKKPWEKKIKKPWD